MARFVIITAGHNKHTEKFMKQAALYIMAILYVVAGTIHFIRPGIYKDIIPPYFPNKLTLVYLSGIVEILLGIGLLFTRTQNIAAWCIILMLTAFIPVHIYMLQSDKFNHLPDWALWGRLPLQLGLMYWAYLYT